jgi:hypothetical protein
MTVMRPLLYFLGLSGELQFEARPRQIVLETLSWEKKNHDKKGLVQYLKVQTPTPQKKEKRFSCLSPSVNRLLCHFTTVKIEYN